jgi:hypothetical protein
MFFRYGIGWPFRPVAPCSAFHMSQRYVSIIPRLGQLHSWQSYGPKRRNKTEKRSALCLGVRECELFLEEPSQFGPVIAISSSRPSLAGSTESWSAIDYGFWIRSSIGYSLDFADRHSALFFGWIISVGLEVDDRWILPSTRLLISSLCHESQ